MGNLNIETGSTIKQTYCNNLASWKIYNLYEKYGVLYRLQEDKECEQ